MTLAANHRSFLHDLEDGVLILDPALGAQLVSVTDGLAAASRRVGPKDEPPPAALVTLLMRLPWVQRGF